MTSRTLATSCTPRHIGPTRSFMNDAGIMPARLTSSCVGARPTTLLFLAGFRTEGPDSSPMAHTARLAATTAPDPPLDRPGLRSVSYGLHDVPPKALRSPPAYSPMFALPMMMAPASRNRCTMVASTGGRSFAYAASAPDVV